MSPSQVISDFLVSHFTDDRLAVLRADAVAGKVPHYNPACCLVAHSALLYGFSEEAKEASVAYAHLSDADDNGRRFKGEMECYRQKRLIPLVDAEINRRALLRAEALEAAVETCGVTAEDLVEVGR